MIIEKRIKEFEKLGFGMFVHFGLYSVHGKGEWAYNINISPEDYPSLFEKFNPDKDWAKNLVSTAKKAGCKYITLTTRHHDGFSLYDTCGLNEYDAPHSPAGRDLIREFVDECNAQGIIPFFYHTLLDWHEKSYKENFPEYLKYLRASVEILCKNYGKIGGLWFDGMWDKADDDWEEDALYGLIRSYQPNAMIINNTGLLARGALGHIELDSVTFERGLPQPINMADSPKYIASEMCQTMNEHWGYTANDFCYKSLKSLIEDFCVCRRYGSNFLLNLGPTGDGSIRALDKAILEEMGRWAKMNEEALYLPRPCEVAGTSKPEDFLLKQGDTYYLFCLNLPMALNPNVSISTTPDNYVDTFKFSKKIKSVTWLDDPSISLQFEQKENGETTIYSTPYRYGMQLVARVAKIQVE